MKCTSGFLWRGKENDVINIPCRHCIACTVNKIQALKFYAQCELSEKALKGYGSTFITLTYNESMLPVIHNGKLYRQGELVTGFNKVPSDIIPTICKYDFVRFMKQIRIDRDRKKLSGSCFYRSGWKYIYNGEYGDIGARPHFHLLMFGIGSQECKQVFDEYWKYGFVNYKPANIGAVRYMSEYMYNDVFGEEREKKYTLKGIEPPFLYHSKGLGKKYFLNNVDFETGFIKLNGINTPVPPYICKKYGIKRKQIITDDNENFNKVLAYVARQRQRGIPVDDRSLYMRQFCVEHKKIEQLISEVKL